MPFPVFASPQRWTLLWLDAILWHHSEINIAPALRAGADSFRTCITQVPNLKVRWEVLHTEATQLARRRTSTKVYTPRTSAPDLDQKAAARARATDPDAGGGLPGPRGSCREDGGHRPASPERLPDPVTPLWTHNANDRGQEKGASDQGTGESPPSGAIPQRKTCQILKGPGRAPHASPPRGFRDPHPRPRFITQSPGGDNSLQVPAPVPFFSWTPTHPGTYLFFWRWNSELPAPSNPQATSRRGERAVRRPGCRPGAGRGCACALPRVSGQSGLVVTRPELRTFFLLRGLQFLAKTSSFFLFLNSSEVKLQ